MSRLTCLRYCKWHWMGLLLHVPSFTYCDAALPLVVAFTAKSVLYQSKCTCCDMCAESPFHMGHSVLFSSYCAYSITSNDSYEVVQLVNTLTVTHQRVNRITMRRTILFEVNLHLLLPQHPPRADHGNASHALPSALATCLKPQKQSRDKAKHVCLFIAQSLTKHIAKVLFNEHGFLRTMEPPLLRFR